MIGLGGAEENIRALRHLAAGLVLQYSREFTKVYERDVYLSVLIFVTDTELITSRFKTIDSQYIVRMLFPSCRVFA